MKDFMSAGAYYLKKDSLFRGISILFIIISTLLFIWGGSKGGFDMNSPLQPISQLSSLSLILYFIIPVHVCFFSTEGFEYGSIKNIISSGQSRTSYVLAKFIIEIKAILWWIFLFFGIYYVLYMAAALITGSRIGMSSLKGDLITALSIIGFNLLYLTAYAAVILMAGTFVRKTASAAIITFAIIFGDLMLSSYLKDTTSTWLRMIADHTLATQVMKFSGVYITNSQHIVLSGINDYIFTTIVPLIVIVPCLVITLISFERRDIHTY